MKKLTAISLLVCLAVYQFGYFAADFWVGKHIEKKWSDQIYAETLDHSNIELIKVPITVPYMPDDKEFKVVNTSYEKDGRFYRVLEQRYRNDTLEMKVVADSYKISLETVIKDWVATMGNDLQSGTMGKLQVKVFSKEFNISKIVIERSASFGLLDEFTHFELEQFYTNPRLEVPTEPPQQV
ncbi:hypothetical protein [Roseivirga sp.]|uniref:hypothetical protein n=1 Tax=Roseivirga sp. TaxID=1964215 RepID=UPI003B52FB2C